MPKTLNVNVVSMSDKMFFIICPQGNNAVEVTRCF